jgi:acyl-CoA thioester hydrolase
VRANRHNFRVIYGDTDQMGVVYYANYLRYFEAGRNELLRAIGLSYIELEQSGYGLPVANVSAKYRAPARYDDELTLETKIVEVGHASVRIAYRLFRAKDDELLTTGETTHVCVGPAGRPTRFPESIRDKMSAD